MIRWCMRILAVLFWVTLIYSVPFLSRLYKDTVADEAAITILTWADIFDPALIDEFTQETGIRVNVNFYESNEEMIVKLEATRGKGYDLVIPSDYAVAVLREKQLLQKLDHTQLPALSLFLPTVVKQPFDPENTYSLPCAWEVYIIGINKDFFPYGAPESWRLLFKPPHGLRVAMASDPREALCFAHQYLYGNPAPVTPEQLQVMSTLLRAQRDQVEAYVEFRADYLLATRNCAAAISSSSYILRSMTEYPHIDFVVPREGTFVTVENFAIPLESQKSHLVNKFISFMCRADVAARHYEHFSFFPSTHAGLQASTLTQREQELLAVVSKLPVHFIQLLTSEKELQKWWISVKA